jgi:peptide/nickel transport system substrate-binding protein
MKLTVNLARKRWTAQLMVMTVLVAACGGTGAGPDNNKAVTLDEITSPAASGTIENITWALPYGEPTSLHWLKALAFSDSTVLANLCEGLTRMTPDFGSELALARSIDRPDDKTYVIELREGVKFSNGDPLTPDDVVYSLSQNLDPAVGSFWAEWFKNVSSIKATGPQQVTVALSRPDAAFEQFLATAGGAIVQKRYALDKGADYGTARGGVMCTGPYTLNHWTPGREIVLAANPTYWDTDHRPKIGQITFPFITNANTLADGLRTGGIDGTFELPYDTIQTLRSSGAGNVYLGKSLGYNSLEFTGKQGPANDVRIRKALSLAMDRESLAKVVYHGAAQPIKSLFFPTTWGYGADTFRSAYDALDVPPGADLGRARELVNEVGATSVMTVLLNADDPTAKQLAAYVKTQAESIGLKVELTELPAAQWIATAFDTERQKAYDLTVSTTGYLDVPDPIEWGVYTLSVGGAFNPSGYHNADVNSWIEQARATPDPKARAALMAKVQTQAYGTDFASVGLVNTASAVFLNKRISGTPVSLNAHFYYPWARDLGGVG